jgi:Ala-tRNA(Pro) deacylase
MPDQTPAPADPAAAPVTPDALFARLDALGIAHTTHRHPPLHTVEESKALRGTLPGGHTKNLFLRDKKRRIWLVVADEDRPVDLKALRKLLGGSGSLSFGSPELLWEVLGVRPGSVTPFGLINDTGHRVTVILDAGLMAHDPINVHPLTNDATTTVARDDLLRFIRACGHEPRVMDLDAEPSAP